MNLDEFIEEHRRILNDRLSQVVREILDARAGPRSDFDTIYRKIVSVILLKSGLGSPTSVRVVREATCALQSVFPAYEMDKFMKLNRQEKIGQINQLTAIVSGIRLMNKHTNKATEGIDDLPSLLKEGIPSTLKTISNEFLKVKKLAAIQTSLYLKLSGNINEPDKLSDFGKACKQAKTFNIDREVLKGSIINLRQHQDFLQILEKDIVDSKESVEQLVIDHDKILQQVLSTIDGKAAVPTHVVYPLFTLLAQSWSKLQDEMVCLSVIANILSNLSGFSALNDPDLNEKSLLTLIQPEQVMFEDQIKPKFRPEVLHGYKAAYPRDESHIIVEEFNRNLISLKGYCPHSLLSYNGLLVPGNIHQGIVVIPSTNDIFAFCSSECADAFLKYKVERECQMQTELHPHETYFDYDYHWNEWELRRKALKLADLRNRQTHSLQTDLSHMRREIETQVWLPKEVGVMCKNDNYSQVPKPSMLIHGLRGESKGLMTNEDAKDAFLKKPNSSFCVINRRTEAFKCDLTISLEDQLLGQLKHIGPRVPKINAESSTRD